MADTGVILEARFQRLFLAQGIFAERSLWVAADRSRKLMATNIDVMISEYASGYHLTRRHAECKSGKRVRILDRVLWLHGVRSLLGADASYLVLDSFYEQGVEFARSLDIDVMTINQLATWERAFEINRDEWPSRSDFEWLDPIRNQARNLAKEKGKSKVDLVIREAAIFVETESWRSFGYGILNRLLRLLRSLSDTYEKAIHTESKTLCVRYTASALLVRLSQYLLAVCLDVSRVPVSDLQSYLGNRLTYGDQDPEQASGLVRSTVDWMSQALRERGSTIPSEADATRLFVAPRFSEGLVALIQKLLVTPNEAKYLPIAMEVEQFGKVGEADLFPRLGSAWRTGSHLAALVRGFAIASLGVKAPVLEPLRQESALPRGSRRAARVEEGDSLSGQTKLSV